MSCNTKFLCVLSVCKHVFIWERSSVHTFFFPPTSQLRELKRRGRGEGSRTYQLMDRLSSPPAEQREKGQRAPGFYIHRCLNTLMCCRCDGSLLISFFLSENDPYIVSTLPRVLLVFEVELCFSGVRKSFRSNLSSSIHSHLLPACSSSYFQPSPLLISWSPLTPS